MVTRIEPIIASTCEDLARNESNKPLVPEHSDSFDQFLIQDPRGLRKAIVPVFLEEDSGIQGMGTAFHVDGWGTFLTAAHVIYEAMKKGPIKKSDLKTGWLNSQLFEKRPSLLLGQGLVYGSVQADLAPIDGGYLVLRESDKPLSNELEMTADIAVVHISSLPLPEIISTLPLRLSRRQPQCGENVLAIGFPELITRPIEDVTYFLSEGMYGAYGQIIKFHPKGTNKTSPTPVIEIQGNWTPGMSGGPVFNQKGEVIGIVSRSIAPDGEDVGHGYGACFQLMPWIRRFLPTVDPSNPCWRLGWAVIRSKPWHLAGFFRSEEEALPHMKTLGPDYQVIFGSNRIGTENFVYHKTK